ncbi:N-acetylmannosamine-6-phosphate 2-epimerase, partial [Streptococcus suis]
NHPEHRLTAASAPIEEGLTAYDPGIEVIGTTLSGYTSSSRQEEGPDIELVDRLCRPGIDVIAEGQIHYPDQVKIIHDLG